MQLRQASAASERTPWIAVIVLGLVFLLTEHTFGVSQQEGFTDATEDMLERAGGGTLSRQLAFLSLAAFGIFQLIKASRKPSRPFVSAMVLAVAFIAWCGLSVLWATDMGMSARRIIVLACCVAGATGMAKQYSRHQLLKLSLVLSAFYLALGIGTEVLLGTFRPWGSDYRFSGSLHPNTQSMNLVVLCLASVCLARKATSHRGLLLALFCAGLTFLVLTKSRTGLAGLIVSMAVLWMGSVSLRFQLTSAAAAAWLALATAFVLLFFGVDPAERLTNAALLGRTEDVTSLTSRVPLWKELTGYVTDRPLLGYGYESFWTADRIEAISGVTEWGVRESHSRYLDTMLSVGLVGLVLMMAVTCFGLAVSAVRYWKTADPGYGFICGMLTFGLIDGLTESGTTSPLFATFVSTLGLLQILWYGNTASKQSHTVSKPVAIGMSTSHAMA